MIKKYAVIAGLLLLGTFGLNAQKFSKTYASMDSINSKTPSLSTMGARGWTPVSYSSLFLVFCQLPTPGFWEP
jgi:hypothetical protein